jgi:hypothetical protein
MGKSRPQGWINSSHVKRKVMWSPATSGICSGIT